MGLLDHDEVAGELGNRVHAHQQSPGVAGESLVEVAGAGEKRQILRPGVPQSANPAHDARRVTADFAAEPLGDRAECPLQAS